MMLREAFEEEFQVQREDFFNFSLGSLGLNLKKKKALCQDFKALAKEQIEAMIKDLRNEKDRVVISFELYSEISKALALGIIEDANDMDFLQELSKDRLKDDWSVFYSLGNAYGNKGKYNEAIDAYEKAITINPKKDATYYNLGIAHDKKREYYQAIQAYQKAIEVNPKRDDVYNNMGITYSKKNEYSQAIVAYKKAIAVNSNKDNSYINMGTAYYHLGLFDEVIKAYTEALKINPNKSEAYTNLFELQLTQNQAFDETLEREYIKRFKAQKEIFIKYEMLKVFQNILDGETSQLEQWQENYKGVSIDAFSFSELRSWIDPMEESETKTKLLETLEVFEGHG